MLIQSFFDLLATAHRRSLNPFSESPRKGLSRVNLASGLRS
jgi:hypothetical protein